MVDGRPAKVLVATPHACLDSASLRRLEQGLGCSTMRVTEQDVTICTGKLLPPKSGGAEEEQSSGKFDGVSGFSFRVGARLTSLA